MSTIQIIMVVVMAMAVQIPVQVLYIRKSLYNPSLTRRSRVTWIVLILLFHLAGIVAYILVNRRKNTYEITKESIGKLNKDIGEAIFITLYCAFEFYSFAIIRENPGNLMVTGLLSISYIILAAIHFIPENKFRTIRNIFPYLLITAIILQDYLSISEEYGFIVLISVAVVIIEYELKYVKIYFWIPLISYQAVSLFKISEIQGFITENYIIGYLLSNTVTYCFVAAACYFAKRQLIQNNQLEFLMHELTNKTKELEEASILKERSRIAREIHDTLGHSLTGAIIQLEVAKKMIHSDLEKAEQSIIKTQEITRRGFSDVKRAIKALKPAGIEEESLQDGLMQLIEYTEDHYHYNVIPTISLPDEISDDLKISVYRIVQELITNSIRHGNSSHLELTIEHQDGMLRISSRDDGEGCRHIREGNGLRGIRERAEHLKGKVYFTSEEGRGFSALIYLPV